MITIKEAAAALEGNEYTQEGSKELFDRMNEAGLVAIFGASDDLAELRGAIHDEQGCYDGGEILVTQTGLFSPRCDNDDCPHEKMIRAGATKIEALWCEEDGISWTYRTDLPHETFHIMEDGEVYCRGIVFSLEDVQW
jgi:hypothetical protein